jgi:hypothetical protein
MAEKSYCAMRERVLALVIEAQGILEEMVEHSGWAISILCARCSATLALLRKP